MEAAMPCCTDSKDAALCIYLYFISVSTFLIDFSQSTCGFKFISGSDKPFGFHPPMTGLINFITDCDLL